MNRDRCRLNQAPPAARRTRRRRGNTMVLVVGILVLLVIIATAYVTRTHAGRVTSLSQQRASLRDDKSQVIADLISTEIAEALFPRPIDPTAPPGNTSGARNSNDQRLSLRPLDRFGGGSVDYFPVRYGVGPFLPYNFAPYHVVPFTNWPDGGVLIWPQGPGAPGGLTRLPLSASLIGAGNPVGNPGYGDTRWLADNEPQRWDSDGDGVLDSFSHWRHMTNLARRGNGLRIVGDISSVDRSVLLDLRFPVEQFLSLRSDAISGLGLPGVPADFVTRWQQWLRSPEQPGPNYSTAYTSPALIPPNFLDLSDLDGDGAPFNDPAGDRPEDEFIPTTARHTVGRVLADADGDGFTDSFWFLVPTVIEGGIRQIAAVRIVDNSGLLNANVATRFDLETTTGATPADLALVGELNSQLAPQDTANIGFYDNADHWGPTNESRYGLPLPDELSDTDFSWLRHVREVGFVDSMGNAILAPNRLRRLDYWRRAGLSPIDDSAGSGYSPFTLADELELRMFHGQNYPWIFSRYEFSTQSVVAPFDEQFLRARVERRETSEYLDQLSNQELLADNRRKLTLFSGARNDLMPPWLWPSLLPRDFDGDTFIDDHELRQFEADMRKLDLRRPVFVGRVGDVDKDVDRDGVLEDPTFGIVHPDLDDDIDGDGDITPADHYARLANRLTDALVQHDGVGGSSSYFRSDPPDPLDDRERSEQMAASFAANIVAYRDEDRVPLAIDEAVEWVDPDNLDDHRAYIGMEAQPFLVEAFIGHVYESWLINDVPRYRLSYGQRWVYRGGPFDLPGGRTIPKLDQSTIVVVQIANPHENKVLNLDGFHLRVFPKDDELDKNNKLHVVDLSGREIDPNSAMTFYAIEDIDLGGEQLRSAWVNELLLAGVFPAAELVTNEIGDLIFSTSRDDYDDAVDGAIELVRMVKVKQGGVEEVAVVVDRIDSPGHAPDETFFEVTQSLELPAEVIEPPPPPKWKVGIRLDEGFTHWIAWAHVTRDWQSVADEAENQKNPRFVFADREVRSGSKGILIHLQEVDGKTQTVVSGFPPDVVPDLVNFHRRKKDCVSCPPRSFAMQMLQKDRDFEQIGELLNVWLFGHELKLEPDPGAVPRESKYKETKTTFSEFMADSNLVGDDERVNRLRFKSVSPGGREISPVIGVGSSTNPDDPLHAIPPLPAGARVLDLFVCDGGGLNPGDLDGDGVPNTPSDETLARLRNANGYSGRATPGLININTAPVEVMRALPHMTRLISENLPLSANPYVRLPEAIVQYREQYNGGVPGTIPTGIPKGADYSDRDSVVTGLRSERGLASIGELMLLTKPSLDTGDPLLEPKRNWQVDFAGLQPYSGGGAGGPIPSTQISTDVVDAIRPPLVDVPIFDTVAQDVEEQNLLFAGISNLITTRSDMFTVYFKVRSFRQNLVTGAWDATNPEYIVDDSRYVMLVDRSEVNHPNDKPRILYLEKLPK